MTVFLINTEYYLPQLKLRLRTEWTMYAPSIAKPLRDYTRVVQLIVDKTPTGSKNGDLVDPIDPVDQIRMFFSLTPIPLITSDLFFANSDTVDPVDHF